MAKQKINEVTDPQALVHQIDRSTIASRAELGCGNGVIDFNGDVALFEKIAGKNPGGLSVCPFCC